MLPMDPVGAAIISGLLGGGAAGALLAGLVTLWQQRRAFEHEKETRFIDLKRQRYADLLRMVDDWVRTLALQHTIANALVQGEASEAEIPALGSTTAIEQLADEIDLLAPESVGAAATRMVIAVIALSGYAYVASRDLRHMLDPVVPINEVLAGYTGERNRFVSAAKADLGTR